MSILTILILFLLVNNWKDWINDALLTFEWYEETLTFKKDQQVWSFKEFEDSKKWIQINE